MIIVVLVGRGFGGFNATPPLKFPIIHSFSGTATISSAVCYLDITSLVIYPAPANFGVQDAGLNSVLLGKEGVPAEFAVNW